MNLELVINALETVSIFNYVAVMSLSSIPMTLCLLIWYKSSMVRSIPRLLLAIVFLSLFGWVFVAAGCLFGPMPDNGFAIVCGILFGWAYVWILGLPILLVSFGLQFVFAFGWWVRRKISRREIKTGKPFWGVAILVFFSLVIYPVVISVKPGEMWKDWNGRSYRVKAIDGIVHLQIRENGEIQDIRTDASSYHRYSVEQKSADELLLKSSDVGQCVLKKDGGKWSCL